MPHHTVLVVGILWGWHTSNSGLILGADTLVHVAGGPPFQWGGGDTPGQQVVMLEPDGGTSFCKEGSATATPLVKRLLERVYISP